MGETSCILNLSRCDSDGETFGRWRLPSVWWLYSEEPPGDKKLAHSELLQVADD